MISEVATNFFSVTGLRILSRILDFILRVYLIRNTLSPVILSELVALDLIMTISLYISKSCFKPSYQQIELKNKEYNIVSAMNLMTVGIPITIVLASMTCFFEWRREQNIPYLHEAMIIYLIAGVVQSVREKYSVQLVLNYKYKTIGFIQLFSYLPKTVLLFIAARYELFQDYGILIFGAGQLLFYVLCLLMTLWKCENKFIFMKKMSEEDGFIDPKTKKVLKERIYISLIKLLLEQFEKIILVVKHVVETSSIYSLISNFGSIAVRFIFSPLEEIAFNYFSRGNEEQSKQTFLILLRKLLIFSFICVTYGFTYSENVLYILYGQKWVSDDSIWALRSYLFLLSVMGLNGTMQSYVMARADHNTTIPKFKYFTIISTSVYLISSYTLFELGFGASGLFLGNSIGMMVRIIVSWNLQIHQHMQLKDFVYQIAPNKIFTLLSLLFMVSIQHINEFLSLNKYLQLLVGIVIFGLNMTPILWQHKDELLKIVKRKRQ